MSRAVLVAAALAHVAAIAAAARPADVAELWAQSRATPADCMTLGLAFGARAYTALLDGEPVAMFGVSAGDAPGEGCPWMVGTTALATLRARKDVLRISRAAIAEFQSLFPVLRNAVDARNTTAIAWLRWLGFTVGTPEPIGVGGAPFCHFVRTA